MVHLVTGANTPLTSLSWTLSIRFPHNIQQVMGIAVLPVNSETQLQSLPGIAHQPPQAWLTIELSADGKSYQLSLDVARLPNQNITRLLVVAYRYSAQGSISIGGHIDLQLNNDCSYAINLRDMDASAIIVAEIYTKSGIWKLRALAETSAYGLVVLARRLGMDLDDSSPYADAVPKGSIENWSGTAFLVAPSVFMTNAHVIDGANHIRLTSLQGTVNAEVLISDQNNDLALIRAPVAANVAPLRFRANGAMLAESVTTLGYPLANLMGSGIQVTQGVIAGLFGAQNDIRLLQFTAAIQPGSSGSPLFDETGAVLGIVSATFTQAQNMNFALRGLLASALIEAVNLPCLMQVDTNPLSASQLAAQLQNAIWKVECTR